MIIRFSILKVDTKVSSRRSRRSRSYLSRDRDRDSRLVSKYYYIRSSYSSINSIIRIITTNDRFFSIFIKFSLVLVIIYSNIIVIKQLNKVKDNI